MKIPENWTFRTEEVASAFDAHVREQLPWYEFATSLVATVARHYISEGAVVYDIGCSTGNIGRAIGETIAETGASYYALDESAEMLARYRGPGIPIRADVTKFGFPAFDLGILFLLLMFIPHSARASFLARLYERLNPGGALVIVDKIETPGGYPGTIMRRMSMGWKLEAGADAEAILKKELSLAGYQRPISELTLPGKPCRFFQMAEFAGWIIEKPLEG
jgi:tRNA (cmo5U34)-methyltransferase